MTVRESNIENLRCIGDSANKTLNTTFIMDMNPVTVCCFFLHRNSSRQLHFICIALIIHVTKWLYRNPDVNLFLDQ